MLDIKLLRNNFEEVEKALSTRNEDFDLELKKVWNVISILFTNFPSILFNSHL